MPKVVSRLPTIMKTEFFVKVEYNGKLYELWAVGEMTDDYKHITGISFDKSYKLKKSEKKAIKKLITETLLKQNT